MGIAVSTFDLGLHLASTLLLCPVAGAKGSPVGSGRVGAGALAGLYTALA